MKNLFKHRYSTLLCMILLVHASCKKEDQIEPNVNLQELLTKLNELRASGCTCGIDVMPPVKKVIWNTALEKTAAAHANDMVTRNYFGHISQEGIPAIQRSRSQGYTGVSIGEVIARYYSTVDEVMNGWKASESHCKAMMDAEYDEVGAGKTGTYWVMDLGRKN